MDFSEASAYELFLDYLRQLPRWPLLAILYTRHQITCERRHVPLIDFSPRLYATSTPVRVRFTLLARRRYKAARDTRKIRGAWPSLIKKIFTAIVE